MITIAIWRVTHAIVPEKGRIRRLTHKQGKKAAKLAGADSAGVAARVGTLKTRSANGEHKCVSHTLEA